jgi:hypothetical protein
VAAPLAEDIAWLSEGPFVEAVVIAVPDVFSEPERQFARLAVTQQRLLWSCHYAIDRFAATLWSLARRGALPALVICSPSGVGDWATAWVAGLRSTLPSGAGIATARYGTVKWSRAPDVRIITYGQLRRLSAGELTALARAAKAVVLDESHKAREETTLTHRAVIQLMSRLAPGTPAIALSTQPIANRLRELCLQLRLLGLDDGPLGDPARLSGLLCEYPNLVAPKLAASGFIIHHDASAVAEYLPRLVRRVVPVPIADEQRQRALRRQREFERFLTTGKLDDGGLVESPSGGRPKNTALAVRTGLELTALLAASPRLDRLLKLNAAIMLDGIRTLIARGKVTGALPVIEKERLEHPTLVLVEHTALGEALSQELRVPYIRGSLKPSERRRLCQEFQDGEYSALVVSMGLEALPPLTRASTVVVMERPWNQAFIDRALRCVYRAGVDHDISVLMLTDEERGLEGFIRHLHVYKGLVAESVLRGIDPADVDLVAALKEAIAIEAAGLHPDDWFQEYRGWLPTRGRRRRPPPSERGLVGADTGGTPPQRWRLRAPGWGEKPRSCVQCGVEVTVGWVVDGNAGAVACDACHATTR